MISEQEKKEAVSLCKSFLRIKSYSGEERGMADLLCKIFSRPPFSECHVDEYGSVIGRIRGKPGGPRVLLDGHIDTVPADAGEWSRDPFSAEESDEKIYGRGASDMKGAVCAMICAGEGFAQENPEFAGDLFFSGTVHEESFEGVAARKVSQAVRPDFVVIGESTGLNLNIGQRGRAEIVLQTYGKSAHSANPKAGVNAVYQMMRLLREIRKLVPPHQEMLGDGILELTDIKSEPYPGKSVVPSLCGATFDRRLLTGETKEGVLQPIQEIIRDLAAKDPKFKASASFAKTGERCYTGASIESERFFPAWIASPDEGYVRRAMRELKSAGIPSRFSHYSFCTNGSHFAGEAGIRTLGFGPSYENVAHTVDEFIEKDQLFQSIEGYRALIRSFLGSNQN